MPDLTPFIAQWGYAAIFVIVILGNLGLPVPEETVLTVSGYLIWQGRLRPLPVVLTAIASAVLGDNVAYWIGRRYGRVALTRFLKVSPERIERMQGLVLRYGMLAVFVARFVAGLRFMAGPLAGTTGLSPLRFFIANLLGALVYVPVAVGVGYAVGYGLGDRIEGLRRFTGGAEHVLLVAIVVAAVGVWLWRARRARAPDPFGARSGRRSR
jgi:membrane protein DedA with SNARE-associated domain